METKLKLEAGKTYVIFDPNGYRQNKNRVHVEAIIPKHGDDSLTSSIIVYRVWFTNKRYWKYFAEPYYAFALFNEWEYEK